jgi:hypothetical protein
VLLLGGLGLAYGLDVWAGKKKIEKKRMKN